MRIEGQAELRRVPLAFSTIVVLFLVMLLPSTSLRRAVMFSRTAFPMGMVERQLSSVSDASPEKGGRSSAAVVQDKAAQSGRKAAVEITLSPPRGTRDFYPEDQRLKTWLFDIWRDTARRYSFEEYDAPVVEHVELYIRKAGEEVTQQLYDFKDKGDRHLSLRPEMTPSLARMVLARKNALPLPIKWFSIPQCWRYERMTRGRRREHYQWNMDIFGVGGVEAEAELLSAIVFSFERMGITSKDVGIKINSRKLLNDLMKRVGIPSEKWVATCVLVDKLDKVELVALTKEINELGLSMSTMEELVSLLQLRTIEEYAAQLGEDAEGVRDIRRLFALSEAYDIRDWVEFDPSVVRGLAYYTGIVFEGFDRSRELRAICGGGRYDKLLESIGGDAVPAVGFGFGDAVIVELLKSKNLLPNVAHPNIDCIAYAMTDGLRGKLMQEVLKLRRQGYAVDAILEEKKPKWVFQRADKAKIPYVVILGEDEDQQGLVSVKNMATGQQQRVAYSELSTVLSSTPPL